MKQFILVALMLLMFPPWSYSAGPMMFWDTTAKRQTRATNMLEINESSKWVGISDAGTVPSAGSLAWLGIDPADGIYKIRKSSGDGGARKNGSSATGIITFGHIVSSVNAGFVSDFTVAIDSDRIYEAAWNVPWSGSEVDDDLYVLGYVLGD